MNNGFIRVGCASPSVKVADVSYNTNQLVTIAKKAEEKNISILVFPELSITGYTCRDLFLENQLLDAAVDGLHQYLQDTKDLNLVSVVGLPLEVGNKIYDVAAVCKEGMVLGFVPKAYVTSLNARMFTTTQEKMSHVVFDDEDVPFGTHFIFIAEDIAGCAIAVEVGDDLLAPYPLSTSHAMAGATIICNPFAKGEIVGQSKTNQTTAITQSLKGICAYVLAGAGEGESTTDEVFAGQKLICENGKVLKETNQFISMEEFVYTDIDLDALAFDRRKNMLFQNDVLKYEAVSFSMNPKECTLERELSQHPFIPEDVTEINKRCETILKIQAQGLKKRMECSFAKKAVVGISGGLDSTLALLVMVKTMDMMQRPRKDVLAVTMPGFGTTGRTKNNATVLCEELGVDFRTVCIHDAVNQHFKDIGHDENNRNVTYENSQARERTQVLMDIANDINGLVVGTGDLSELALGWATYNGDHMSMYGVNADVPKTLIRHVVAYYANEEEKKGNGKIADVLRDILATPVSPELLPADKDGKIAQKTEDLVGPYELHDFFLYHLIRHGATPRKLYCMASKAFEGIYDDETIKKWLKVFVRRFFTQQFKRSCLADGPKVGTVGISPRGELWMPSDVSANIWLNECDNL